MQTFRGSVLCWLNFFSLLTFYIGFWIFSKVHTRVTQPSPRPKENPGAQQALPPKCKTALWLCQIYHAAAAKLLQSCPTLWDPIEGSPPGSAVPGIFQARTLEWVAISFSNAWKWKVKVKSLSRVRLLATPWTAAYQAPPSMGFSRQEYWSGVPLPSPRYVIGTSKQQCLETHGIPSGFTAASCR